MVSFFQPFIDAPVAYLVFLLLGSIVGWIWSCALCVNEKYVDESPKLRRRKVYKVVCTTLLLGVIVTVSLVISAVHYMHHDIKEFTMGNIVEEAMVILAVSRRKLESSDFSATEWPKIESSMRQKYSEVVNIMNVFLKNIHRKANFQIEEYFKVETASFGTASELLQILNKPTLKMGMNCREELFNLIDIMQVRIYGVSGLTVSMNDAAMAIRKRIEDIGNDTGKITEQQIELNDGRKILEKKRKFMEMMMDHFELDMNNAETTRQLFMGKMKAFAPPIITGTIIKCLVTLFCIVILVLAILSTLALVRPTIFGQSATSVIFICFIVCLLLISAIIFNIVEDSYMTRRFKCRTREYSFGLNNMTTDFVYSLGVRTLRICSKPETSFYGGHLISITQDDIFENLRINEYKENIIGVLNGLPPVRIPLQIAAKLEEIQEIYRSIGDLSRSKCTEKSLSNAMLKLENDIGKYLNVTKKVYDDFSDLNSVIGGTQYLRSKVTNACAKIVTNFGLLIDAALIRGRSANFPCHTLTSLFDNIGPKFCAVFDFKPPTLFPFLVIIIVIYLVLSLVLGCSWIVSISVVPHATPLNIDN